MVFIILLILDWARATHNHRPHNFHVCTVCHHSHKERKVCLPVSYDYVVPQFHYIKLLQILRGFFAKTQSLFLKIFSQKLKLSRNSTLPKSAVPIYKPVPPLVPNLPASYTIHGPHSRQLQRFSEVFFSNLRI